MADKGVTAGRSAEAPLACGDGSPATETPASTGSFADYVTSVEMGI